MEVWRAPALIVSEYDVARPSARRDALIGGSFAVHKLAVELKEDNVATVAVEPANQVSVSMAAAVDDGAYPHTTARAGACWSTM